MKRLIILLVLAPLLLFFITSVIFSYYMWRLHGDAHAAGVAVGDAVPYFLMVNHAILFVILLLFLKGDDLSLREIGWRVPGGARGLVLQLALGIIAGGLLYGISDYAISPMLHHVGIGSGAFQPGKNFPMGAFFVSATLFAGVVEESIWRGYAITLLQERLGKPWALLISSFLFCLIHFGLGWEGVINAFLIGLLLGVIYLWRRDLVMNAAAHATSNAVELLVSILH